MGYLDNPPTSFRARLGAFAVTAMGSAVVAAALTFATSASIDRATQDTALIGLEIYSGCARLFVNGFIWWALCMLLASAAALLLYKDTGFHKFIWCCWVIVPPVWFTVEYFYLFPIYGNRGAGAVESLKYGQTAAQYLWATGAVLSTAVLYSELQSPRKGPASESRSLGKNE